MDFTKREIQVSILVIFGCRIRTPWKEISNLHFLWDAAGGLYLTEWPLVQEEPWQNKSRMIVKDSSTFDFSKIAMVKSNFMI